jgi:Swt1-like HEPN
MELAVAVRRSVWTGLPTPVRSSLERAWSMGVPGYASALHARWWQLETWLRSLVYVELRSRFGSDWTSQISQKAVRYAQNEARLAYMPSPDAELVLAYLDVYDLFGLIDEHWELFEASLIDKDVWKGRVKELRQIRHRIAHCRRPHVDDLSRVEQCMRDLETGAFKAVTSFNKRAMPAEELDDPVVAAWGRGEHPDARRLIAHAERNYDVFFRLTYSRRPWADAYHSGTKISGRPGFLWHAVFDLHGDGFEVANLWNDYEMSRPRMRRSIVFLCADSPTSVDVSFAAVDDPQAVADLIGDSFDAVLRASRYGWREGSLEDGFDKWAERAANLDPRVQVSSAWLIDESTTPITIFRTGSGTGLDSPFY